MELDGNISILIFILNSSSSFVLNLSLSPNSNLKLSGVDTLSHRCLLSSRKPNNTHRPLHHCTSSLPKRPYTTTSSMQNSPTLVLRLRTLLNGDYSTPLQKHNLAARIPNMAAILRRFRV